MIKDKQIIPLLNFYTGNVSSNDEQGENITIAKDIFTSTTAYRYLDKFITKRYLYNRQESDLNNLHEYTIFTSNNFLRRYKDFDVTISIIRQILIKRFLPLSGVTMQGIWDGRLVIGDYSGILFFDLKSGKFITRNSILAGQLRLLGLNEYIEEYSLSFDENVLMPDGPQFDEITAFNTRSDAYIRKIN